jgi:hypothetical protein
MAVSRYQNVGQNYNLLIAKKSFESIGTVEIFRSGSKDKGKGKVVPVLN